MESKKTGLMDWLINHSKKILIALVVLVLLTSSALIGVALFNKMKNDPNVVAEVNGEKIYLSEYQKRFTVATYGFSAAQTTSAKSYAKDVILDDLIQEKILDQELANRNLKITDENLTAAAKEEFTDFDNADKAKQANYKILASKEAKTNVLESKVAAQRVGNILFCRFDRDIQDDYKGKTAAAEALRTKQMAYAKDYCAKAKDRLETGTSDFKTELQNLEADPVIGKEPWKPFSMIFGAGFTKNYFSKNVFPPSSDTYEQILNVKADKEKGYYALTIKDTGESGAKGQDKMYGVLYLEDKGSAGETTDFTTWLQNKFKEYQTKKFPERIK